MKIIDFRGSRYDPCACICVCVCVNMCASDIFRKYKVCVFSTLGGNVLFKKISSYLFPSNLFLREEGRNMENLLSYSFTKQRKGNIYFTQINRCNRK